MNRRQLETVLRQWQQMFPFQAHARAYRLAAFANHPLLIPLACFQQQPVQFIPVPRFPHRQTRQTLAPDGDLFGLPVFYRCQLSDTNPRFRKYPTLPVLNCAGWRKVTPKQFAPVGRDPSNKQDVI